MSARTRYDAFPFVVREGERDVAGFSEVSGLQPSLGDIDYRDDRVPASLRRVATSPMTTHVTLQRGITDDAAFQGWLLAAVSGGVHDTPEMLSERTRTLVVAVRDAGGEEVVRFDLVGCWASAVTGSATGSGATDALAIESLVLQVEGVTRT
ncbi:MAG: phage tail protein [Gemmatimonadetes bacterium]|nr:phage tail protein [Gemmatimonadota bacterium]